MKKITNDNPTPPLLDWFDQVASQVDNEKLADMVLRKIKGSNPSENESTRFWYGGLTLLFILNIVVVIMFARQLDPYPEIVYQREELKEISNQFLIIAQVP